MTAKSYCFDIEPGWGTHTLHLEAELANLAPGSLVIEHGAGMYSSTLISTFDLKVVCIEEAPGWASWAQWLYGAAGRDVTVIGRAKESRSYFADAQLLFVDGAARERGDLVRWALDAGVPVVIAHDTEDDERKKYGYRLDARADYSIEHSNARPATTIWRKVTPP